jgi:hypothetical protein
MALTENGHALAVIPTEQEAALTYKLSTNAAGLCGAIVKATAMKIQGRQYVKAEGWLAIAVAHGCVVSVRDVEQVEGGIRAIAELRRMSDQALIATAEGFVGDDEKMWAGRPMFARRAMAQTRAGSRVCRTVFAHVVVMIDASLATTPAEEMQGAMEAEQVHVIGNGDTLAQAAREITEQTGNDVSTYKIEAAKKAEKDAGSFIDTIKLSGQTDESLAGWWKANARRLKGLHDNHPEQYERVEKAFVEARDAARDRAA